MQSARNQYLEAMGIQVWHLREPLAGGKAFTPTDSTRVEAIDDVRVQPVAVASPPIAQTQEQAVSIEQKASSVSERSPEISEPRVNPSEPELAVTLVTTGVTDKPEDANIETNPVFRMASIIYPGCCLVVTEVPVQGAEPVAQKQLVLLKNLLLSLGCKVSEQPIVTLFNWPMLRTPGFDQSADAARDACQAFLRGQKSKHTVSFVLLMGQQAGRYMLGQSEPFEAAKGQLLSTPEQASLVSYSIQQLYDQPKLKAQLWQDVQPLRNWLKTD